MKKVLSLFILNALLSACSTLPSEYSKSPGRTPVVGKRYAGVKTQIRSVDNGEILFVRENKLGNKVWLYPGNHILSVTCVAGYPWGCFIDHVDVPLTVKLGYRYELQGRFDNKEPAVDIKEVPVWLE